MTPAARRTRARPAKPKQTKSKQTKSKQTKSKQTKSKQTKKQTAKAQPPRKKKDSVTSTASSRTTSTAARSRRPARRPGRVSFVGTGPGDPGLLTVRAVELIRAADVVITDSAEHDALVDALRTAAAEPPVVVDGASNGSGSPLTQSARGRLVVKHARCARLVARLITGDPWLHSAGAEEAMACAKAGVPFDVVPGVSPASGVAAYAGVPLTTRKHREVSFVRVTGKVDWSTYATDQTLVLLSAVGVIGDVAAALVAAGRPGDTPVAVTWVGTTTSQHTVVSSLDDVAADLAATDVSPAAVVVVGDVVDLREQLSWFETKPLFGWRVLVPRTKDQAGALSERLRAHGAVPEEVPTISVEPPRNPQQMDKAIRGLVEGRYEWIAFTSVNAVRAVREKFDEYGLDARAFSGLKVAAVGASTADAISTWGIRPDLVPSGEQSVRGLLADWPPYDDVLDPINRVFLPRADIATETLVAGLVDLGWEVDDVTAYRTVRAAPPPAPVREAIKAGKFDAVVFTSSSTVRNLVGIAGKPNPNTVVACIGPATAKTAEEHGLRVDVLAPEPSVEVVAETLADFGLQRRLASLEAGEPVVRPSERRPVARRKAT